MFVHIFSIIIQFLPLEQPKMCGFSGFQHNFNLSAPPCVDGHLMQRQRMKYNVKTDHPHERARGEQIMSAHIKDFAGKQIHFVGIGGCSMSGLAGLLRRQGYKVTGSDNTKSHKTDALNAQGIPVAIGHDAAHIEGADVLVYSAAISVENPERAAAAAQHIPQIERAALIGQLMEGYAQAIGISGTHGKTTTTAMMAQVAAECGTKPTAHFGGELDALGGSTIEGNKDLFVVESCEFAMSFLKFHPTIAVILNIDEDHLDCYRDIDHIEQTFLEFARLTPEEGGWVVGCGDDERCRRVMAMSGRPTLSFGLRGECDISVEQLTYDSLGCANCVVTLRAHQIGELMLSVPGEHNLIDALAVVAASTILELPMQQVMSSLNAFAGAHRRFELTSVTDAACVYTDYAHNPTETKNALAIARKAASGRVFAVLQPHTYSRTKKLFDQWMTCFGDADKVVVTNICAARESDPGDINAQMLVDAMCKAGIDATLTPSFDDAERHLRANWQPGDLIITLGCGDIDLLNEQIIRNGDTKR